jgi:hypothetical protein
MNLVIKGRRLKRMKLLMTMLAHHLVISQYNMEYMYVDTVKHDMLTIVLACQSETWVKMLLI